EAVELAELRLDVGALLQQARLGRFEHRQEALELGPLVAARLVHVDQLADLGERQPQALAAQRELEPRAVARRVDAALAVAPRRNQPLVFVEADRARRDAELVRQFADRKLAALRFLDPHGRVQGILAECLLSNTDRKSTRLNSSHLVISY